jgi:hypothetical protein
MKKTALKQLIDYMEHGGAGSENPFEIKRYAKLLLKIEEKQIVLAWESAYGGDNNLSGEQYYHETHKSE